MSIFDTTSQDVLCRKHEVRGWVNEVSKSRHNSSIHMNQRSCGGGWKLPKKCFEQGWVKMLMRKITQNMLWAKMSNFYGGWVGVREGWWDRKCPSKWRRTSPPKKQRISNLEQELFNLEARFFHTHPGILFVKCRPVCRSFILWKPLFWDDWA